MSPVAIALLVAALALLAAAEWPRLVRRAGVVRPPRGRRPKRRRHLQVVDDDDESDDFARSVERDLANLPTIDERDRR